MKKSDLKQGMVVAIRNGTKFQVTVNYLVNSTDWMPLDDFEENFKFKGTTDFDRDYDITKIYEAREPYQLCEKNWGKMHLIWNETQESCSEITVDTETLIKLLSQFLKNLQGEKGDDE